MPYIKQGERTNARAIGYFPQEASAGYLHYRIAQLIDSYMTTNGVNYQTWNDVMGVLACAQQEIYRRFIAPYEDIKIAQNGEVYQGISNHYRQEGLFNYGIKEDSGNTRGY